MFFTQKIKKQLSGADAIKLLQFLLWFVSDRPYTNILQRCFLDITKCINHIYLGTVNGA
jgi:hypothetical protein